MTTNHDADWLAQRFEGQRAHLRAVAYRMLGSLPEAEDAVQESWLRLSRTDASGVENLGGWLTTTVARVCLDMLRSRKSRREELLSDDKAAELEQRAGGVNPEDEALLADSMGLALLVVLETLAPAERLAFVLHDLFDVPFDEIAPIVGRTPTAARQLASRARRRVQRQPLEEDEASGADLAAQRTVVEAFLAASRNGDFAALLAVLDPEVELRNDEMAARPLAPKPARGAQAVAEQLVGRASVLQPALLGGSIGAVYAPAGRAVAAFRFTFAGGRIAAIEIVGDPQHLRRLDPQLLGD